MEHLKTLCFFLQKNHDRDNIYVYICNKDHRIDIKNMST